MLCPEPAVHRHPVSILALWRLGVNEFWRGRPVADEAPSPGASSRDGREPSPAGVLQHAAHPALEAVGFVAGALHALGQVGALDAVGAVEDVDGALVESSD